MQDLAVKILHKWVDLCRKTGETTPVSVLFCLQNEIFVSFVRSPKFWAFLLVFVASVCVLAISNFFVFGFPPNHNVSGPKSGRFSLWERTVFSHRKNYPLPEKKPFFLPDPLKPPQNSLRCITGRPPSEFWRYDNASVNIFQPAWHTHLQFRSCRKRNGFRKNTPKVCKLQPKVLSLQRKALQLITRLWKQLSFADPHLSVCEPTF